MENSKLSALITNEGTKEILLALKSPRTPKLLENQLEIKKLKIKPFLRNNLLDCLNPKARKGRIYVLSDYAKEALNISDCTNFKTNWRLIGYIIASPKQRYAILMTVAIDFAKRTSEEIRAKASKINQCLTRISTKRILNELVGKKLIETCLDNHKRYYWISKAGKKLAEDINFIFGRLKRQ